MLFVAANFLFAFDFGAFRLVDIFFDVGLRPCALSRLNVLFLDVFLHLTRLNVFFGFGFLFLLRLLLLFVGRCLRADSQSNGKPHRY